MKASKRRVQRARPKERGIIFALTALGFMAFLLAAGLAVDVSRFFLAGAELQNAADAAAIAGASALNSTKNGLDAAIARATVAMNKYEFNVATANISAADVRFAKNLAEFENGGNGVDLATAKTTVGKIRFVRVNVTPVNIGVAFSHMLFSGGNVAMTRFAVAGQSTAGANPDTPTDPGFNCIGNPAALALIEDDVYGQTLNIAAGTNCANNTVYTKGCTYDLTIAPPCAFQASTYVTLDRKYSDATNPITSRQKQLASGLRGQFCYNERAWLWVHPPTATISNALNTFFNVYAGEIPAGEADNFPPDVNIQENISFASYKEAVSGEATFTSPSGRTGVVGRRIMVLPIVKSSSGWYDVNDPMLETATANFYKYGAFFLVKRPGSSGQLQLEYITDRVSVGSGSLNPTAPMPVANSIPSTAVVSAGISVPVLYR